MSGHRVEASRLVGVEPALAFDRLIRARLPDIFNRRYAAFPPVKDVIDAPDTWDTAGQSRTIVLADGGGARETLTKVDPPHSYAYVLDELQGPLRAFVREVEGEWTVTPEGTASRVGWSWTLHPKRSPGRLTVNVIGRMWKGYAENAFDNLEVLLLGD